MISQDMIKKLAVKYQTTEINVSREYFQHVFLSNLYKQPEGQKIFFKGGTALRIIYQSPRFSEDLDFSSSLSPKTIENTLTDALVGIERENIPVSFGQAKTTSGGYLAVINFESVTIHLEISLRQKDATGDPTTIISDFTIPYTLFGLKKDELISQKIQALKARQKARDFFDLYFILRSNLLPTNQKRIITQVPAILESKLNSNFEKELKVFLPKSHWAVVRNFKEVLLGEIRRQAP